MIRKARFVSVNANVHDFPDEAIRSYSLPVKDGLVVCRVVASLTLAALLMIQSVVPCCALNRLLSAGTTANTTSILNSCGCDSCHHVPNESGQTPREDNRSPQSECPTCAGLFYFSAPKECDTFVKNYRLVFAFLSFQLDCLSSEYVRVIPNPPRVVLVRSSIELSMRLLV